MMASLAGCGGSLPSVETAAPEFLPGVPLESLGECDSDVDSNPANASQTSAERPIREPVPLGRILNPRVEWVEVLEMSSPRSDGVSRPYRGDYVIADFVVRRAASEKPAPLTASLDKVAAQDLPLVMSAGGRISAKLLDSTWDPAYADLPGLSAPLAVNPTTGDVVGLTKCSQGSFDEALRLLIAGMPSSSGADLVAELVSGQEDSRLARSLGLEPAPIASPSPQDHVIDLGDSTDLSSLKGRLLLVLPKPWQLTEDVLCVHSDLGWNECTPLSSADRETRQLKLIFRYKADTPTVSLFISALAASDARIDHPLFTVPLTVRPEAAMNAPASSKTVLVILTAISDDVTYEQLVTDAIDPAANPVTHGATVYWAA